MTMHTTLHIKQVILTGLRDFFAAENAKAMQAAYEALLAANASCARPQSLCNSNAVDWLEAEYDFNRLFVGPKDVIAPLFASVYLDSKGILMGEHTVQMRSLMHELNLASPHEGSIPEDFLPYELEVLSILYTLLMEHEDNAELHNALLEAIEWLEEHIASWIPLFMAKARSKDACSPPLADVFAIMEHWLLHTTKNIL